MNICAGFIGHALQGHLQLQQLQGLLLNIPHIYGEEIKKLCHVLYQIYSKKLRQNLDFFVI